MKMNDPRGGGGQLWPRARRGAAAERKVSELRAATSLARLWFEQGKNSEAGNCSRPVYGWFTEGFDTEVLTKRSLCLPN